MNLFVTTIVLCQVFLGSYGLTINSSPSNRTGLVGSNVTFACDVTKTAQENVFWKRVEGSSTTLIGYNELSKNTTKYVIAGTFNLTILDVQLGDEGFYECEAGQTKPQAFLQIGVAPISSNVTVAWQNESAPVYPNTERRMVCAVYNSRPAATIRWFKGNTDVTKDVISYTATTTTGYGDATSILKVTPAPDDTGALFHCKVDLPDNPAVVTKTLTLAFGSGSAHVVASFTTAIFFSVLLQL